MFYDNFIIECNKNNISPTAAALKIGFPRSIVTIWKNGSKPRDANLKKIADYFGVTVDYLLREKENAAQLDGIETTTDKLIKAVASLSEDKQKQLLEMIRLFEDNR